MANVTEVTCPFAIEEDTMREGTEAADVKLGALTSPNADVSPVLGANVMTNVNISLMTKVSIFYSYTQLYHGDGKKSGFKRVIFVG